MELKPEDKAKLEELEQLRNNLDLEIESRKRSKIGSIFAFHDLSLQDLEEWVLWVRNHIEEVLAPYEKD